MNYPVNDTYILCPVGSGDDLTIRFPFADTRHIGCKFTLIQTYSTTTKNIWFQSQLVEDTKYQGIWLRSSNTAPSLQGSYNGYNPVNEPTNSGIYQAYKPPDDPTFGGSLINITFMCLPYESSTNECGWYQL